MSKNQETVRLSPFTCTSCRHVLGYTDGKVLDLETATVTLPMTVACKNCGAERQWLPSDARAYHLPGGRNKKQPDGPAAA